MTNTKVELVNDNQCTACGACVQVCPQKCISFRRNKYDCIYAVIDRNMCIGCKKCKNVCHLENCVYNSKSNKVYVAWSLNDNIRKTSASGGIATEMYRLCFEEHVHCYGVASDGGGETRLKELISYKDVENSRNSRYVFSSTENCFSEIERYLLENEKVLFIGLPCQVAGIKSFLKGTTTDNLITVDLVCHGTCPYEYLEQHIRYIEKQKKQKTELLQFRDPTFGTKNYQFTMSNGHNLFYRKGVYDSDVYQIGYHKSLIYREACYNCKYARAERVGDITIADFNGLGKKAPWERKIDSVSMVIVSTGKGKKFIEKLVEKKNIYVEERPADEAFLYEHQLNAPSKPHDNRNIFLNEYDKTHNFEKAAKKATRKDVCKNMILKILHVRDIKRVAVRIIPKKIKNIIKRFFYCIRE